MYPNPILMTVSYEFVMKSGLPEAFGAEVDQTRFGEEFLALKHPAAVARFVAFAKSRPQYLDAQVFMRGQDDAYPGLVPSIFRKCNPKDCERLSGAYLTALSRIQEALPQGRFRRDNIGSLLQHYGFKTPWLDVVDNLYTAFWFATRNHVMNRRGESCYYRSRSEYGWLYLVATRGALGGSMHAVDLRKNQSSMSVRPQAQHGYSLSPHYDGEPCVMSDYSQFVVARVRFPNTKDFKLLGSLAKTDFLFPPPQIDESFDLLLKSRSNEVTARLEKELQLRAGSLGAVNLVKYISRGRRPAPMPVT